MTEHDYSELQRIKDTLWSEEPAEALLAAEGRKKLVATGDSWFDDPLALDLLDQLRSLYGYKIYRVSRAGDTLDDLVFGRDIRRNFTRRTPQVVETLDAIRTHRPKVVLLSGGASDLLGDGFETLLNHKDSGLAVLRCAAARSLVFEVLANAYESFLRRVWAVDDGICVVAHGYGYPVPDGRGVPNLGGFDFVGPWLRPALARKNVLDRGEGRQILRQLVDWLNEMLAGLDAKHGRFHHLDWRSDITDDDWSNELHLSSAAYRRAAGRLHDAVQQCMRH